MQIHNGRTHIEVINMKNRRMSTTITLIILIVNTVCISLLYFMASRTMTTLMKQSEMANLHASLNVHTNIIEEYIHHQEDLLITYSNESVVIEYLKDPSNDEKKELAQQYTEKYYSRLDNWEGLYIGEWDTHVIAHSNPDVVGMVTREGEPLKQLQNEMLSRNGLYNAGIIVSPASGKLILSLYCPVYDHDGVTIIGYVGGGPYAEELEKLLLSVEDENAKYYMLNVLSGMYIFAENKELMATKIQDEMLLSIIEILETNDSHWNGNKEYVDEIDGKSIAAYQYMPEHGWVVISCNSEKNIYADVSRNMKILGLICIVSDIVIGVLSWIFIRISTKPLKYAEESIVQLKEMKLEKQHKLDDYINCKSEIGQIATAIDSLYDSIKDMLEAEKEKQVAIAASESKAKFLANISHEIRTPINAVIGMNEMILRENKDETIQEYAYSIKSSSQMLLGIINDVLDFSKIEAGKLRIVENNYQVATMFRDVITGIKTSVKDKNLEFNVEIDETIPAVLVGDEIRIKQILNNLLSNAVKYTEKGSITFKAKGMYDNEKFYLWLSVADTGIGIRKEDMERLFNSFQRLELEKNRYIQGTGLGLNITKQLTDNMNGKIEVESEYGKGSCFTVVIPQGIAEEVINEEIIVEGIITKEIATEGIEVSQGQNDTKEDKNEFLYAPNAKVLIVDDHKMNLVVMKGLLKRSQIQLDYATGGEQCLEMTKKNQYDLILMDHMMPEPDGIQTLHMIREDKENKNVETKVIVLTANATEGIEEEYLKEGFVGYLSKPIEAEKLEEMLREYLG